VSPITSQPHGIAPQGGAVLVVERSYRCGFQIVHPLSDSAAQMSPQPRCFTERRRTDTQWAFFVLMSRTRWL
jgi:hypothetical protein